MKAQDVAAVAAALRLEARLYDERGERAHAVSLRVAALRVELEWRRNVMRPLADPGDLAA